MLACPKVQPHAISTNSPWRVICPPAPRWSDPRLPFLLQEPSAQQPARHSSVSCCTQHCLVRRQMLGDALD